MKKIAFDVLFEFLFSALLQATHPLRILHLSFVARIFTPYHYYIREHVREHIY